MKIYENDEEWIKKRMDCLNEEQIQYFIEKVGSLMNDGMPEKQARPAALILLIDWMRL